MRFIIYNWTHLMNIRPISHNIFPVVHFYICGVEVYKYGVEVYFQGCRRLEAGWKL